MRFRRGIRNPEKCSDVELFEMLSNRRSDSEQAFKELYRRYAPRVHAYCYKILEHREEAEDVFQETFVRFFNSAGQNRTMTNVSGFLLRIARNLCLNRRRDRVPTQSLEGIDIPMRQENSLERRELLELIARATEMLDAGYREAFILREYQGMSYEEIAELTGSTVSNAKSRVFRARRKIQEILAPKIRELR